MKFLLVPFLILFIPSYFTFGQEVKWQNTLGGNEDDRFPTIIQTLDGGYLVGGTSKSDSSGDKSENPIGGWFSVDFWIVKINSEGLIQWENTIGGNGDDNFTNSIQTADGGYLLTGTSWSGISGDKTEASQGQGDFWMIKIDANSNMQWQNTIGGSLSDDLIRVIATADGGYFLGGISKSNISGDKNENCVGGWDYWVIKTDSIGSIQWQNTIGGNGDDYLEGIDQTNDGGFILGGTSSSNISGDKSENAMDIDYWLVKIDEFGNIIWENTLNAGGGDLATSIINTSDGGILVGGFSNSMAGLDKSENSSYIDYWIVKLDSSGNVEWDNTIGGSGYEYLYCIIENELGGFTLAGKTSSIISRDQTENIHGIYGVDEDNWIINLDSTGNIVWQNVIGGNDDDYLESMIQSEDGNLVLCGYSKSNISGDKTENSLGEHDYWILKLSNNVNIIKGNAFGDLNSNLLQDFNELPLINHKITENNSGKFTYTQFNGNYTLTVSDTGNFESYPQLLNNYTSIPAVQSSYFANFQQMDLLNDFVLQPNGSLNDLCVSITPNTLFRSGFNSSYTISYFNYGTTTLTPTIVFYPDSNVNYLSASMIPTLITSDSVVFTLANLLPLQNGQIIINIFIQTGLLIGSIINSGVMILPIVNDVNPGCNSSYWEVPIIGSFDPNDILVNRNYILDYELVTPSYLEYIIRFQNTGNDTAFTVKLLNPIDTTSLDLSTLQIINSSHNLSANYISWQRNMEFVFNNILLPDSNINEMMSHGFVRYKIKPKTTLVVGDTIQNYAAIYFDYNSPVMTNTALTTILTPNSTSEHNQSTIAIFPNPTNNTFTIQLMGTSQKIRTVEVYNVLGKQEKYLTVTPATSTEIDISQLSSGIYFIKINNENSVFGKIVKN